MKITRTLAGGALLATLLSTSVFAQERTLQLGHLANEDNSWHLAAVKFGEELSALTDGRIAVEVFPNESLGKEIDLINGMQLGTVDMTITGESLQNWAPMAALLAVPYGYKSIEHMDEVASGDIGDQIEAQIVDKAQIRPIAYFARGARELTSNRPITSPDELNGLKMRVPNVPLFIDVWSALGANPGPMAFSEVFTSLQNGTIEAQENPLPLNALVGKELTLQGTQRFQATDFAEAVRLISERCIDVRPMVTGRYPLAEAAAAFRVASDRTAAVKIQLVFGEAGPGDGAA
jgi:tripartite ATP-independent transporter DctP family solute receptor